MHSMPYQLATIQHQSVIATIGPDSFEGRKLSTCRFHSGCNSSICPRCLWQAGVKKAKSLMEAAIMLPESRLTFPSFITADVPLEGLKPACEAIMKAGRATMKALRIADFALAQETSIAGENFHPHAHALTSTPTKGRGYVASAAWEDAWLSNLPAYLHPNRSAVHVEAVEDFNAVATYVCKSPFSKATSDQSIKRIVDSLFETKGIHRFETSGKLKIDLRGSVLALAA
jgi:hypothetical protein